jgi:membrane-bound serine protease (ClpP class)
LSVNSARVAFLAAALVANLAANLSFAGEEGGRARLALSTSINGAIGPASARQLEEALAVSAERHAEVLILRLNTPGGLVTSTREMIADILASPVPVVGYVAPAGGHAASAGTYILYATHVAAMAPGTNIGAATPVELGGPTPWSPGGGDKGKEEDKNPKDATGPPQSGDAMSAKQTNDAVALIRSLAELRGRNADWAETAVREAASLSANAALQQRVVEIVARDSDELLKMADGRMVEVGGGRRPLSTADVMVETIEPGWFIELLSIITNPNVALILMLIGFYGLVFEFSTPGAIAPGVIGTICLLLGLYALNLLPINYAGLALMLLGLVFLVVEAFNPTVVLGLGGVTAFLLGAAMLLKIEGPGFELSWLVIGGAAAFTLGLALVTGSYLWAARRNPSRVGAEAMKGLPAKIVDWSQGEGHVLAQGEIWRARSQEDFKQGDSVEVRDIQGLVLSVERRQPGIGERP